MATRSSKGGTGTGAGTRATNPTDARAQKPKQRTTPPRTWRKVFLRELAIDGNRRRAAEAAHVDHSTAYEHRNSDPEFRAAWDEAVDRAGEHLEAEAWRRAAVGDEKPLTSAKGLIYDDATGAPVTVREYSDSLMQLLLKGARPLKYRERVTQEHTGGQTLDIRITRRRPEDAEGATS